VRTARRASELTRRPPTITKSIDQLGDPVGRPTICPLASASPTLLKRGLPRSKRERRDALVGVDRCYGTHFRASTSDWRTLGDNRLARLFISLTGHARERVE